MLGAMHSKITPTEPVVASRGPSLQRFQGGSLVALIAASVAVGTGLAFAGLQALQWWERRQFAEAQMELAVQLAPPAAGVTRLNATTLQGPKASLTLPPGRPMIVNVWLQGCADCMPAFSAWREHRGKLSTAFPVANIAYGQADEAWARSYLVDDTLVFDEGSAVVKPLGIGSFTTLVVDADGVIVFRDRPDGAGFFERMTGAMAALQGRARNTLGSAEALAPFRAAEQQLKDCLGLLPPAPTDGSDTSRVTLKVRIGTDGRVPVDAVVIDAAPMVRACFQDTIALMRWPTFSGPPLDVAVPFSIARRR